MIRKTISRLAIVAAALTIGAMAHADTAVKPTNWHLLASSTFRCRISISGVSMGAKQWFQCVVLAKGSYKPLFYSDAMPTASADGNTLTLTGDARWSGLPAKMKIVATDSLPGGGHSVYLYVTSPDGHTVYFSDGGVYLWGRGVWSFGWD